MMSQPNLEEDHHIAIQRDAISSAIVSGDGNKVVIYNYHLDRQVEIETKPTTPHLATNPYRGLAAFQVEDAEVYFGREAQVDRLWNRLRELQERATQNQPPVRLLPILGASGSGKSSLARAGLLPELARRPLPGYRQPRVVVMTPGSSPLQSLAVVLARIATGDPTPVEKAAEFERVLNKPNDQNQMDGLKRTAYALPNIDHTPLVILIDQFEEAYSLCKDREIRDRFIDTLVNAAAAPEARVSVVMTLRSDFLGETQKHPQLDQIIGSDQCVVVTAMTSEELRRAIAEPAKQAGHPFNEGLVDRLVEQTEGREGTLPLLQFALTRMWEGLEQGKSPPETLKAIGGVGGALAGEAQRIYNSLNDKEKDITRCVFIGLVELGEGTKDTRRRATIESLVSAQDNATLVREVIGRFAVPGARLLTLSSIEGKEVAEVTHEALLDHWQQIREWLDGQQDRIRQQRRINALAQEWEKQGKKRGYLLQGRQLDDSSSFQKRYAETLPLTERAVEFVRKSLRHRWLNRAAIASFLILPMLVVDSFLREDAVQRNYATLDSKDIAGKPEAAKALTKGCRYWQISPGWFAFVGERIFGTCRTLESKNLATTYFRSANLSKVNLSYADLSKANLSYADLSKANLIVTSLRYADLNVADLGSADLSSADLSYANLNYANLSYADLQYVDLSYANLNKANLSGADLGLANLSYANLSGANLSYADLSLVTFNGAVLLRTDLSNSTGLEQLQLTNSKYLPLLCNTKLPTRLKHLADHDCDRLPQELLKRYPDNFKTLEEAKQYVEQARML